MLATFYRRNATYLSEKYPTQSPSDASEGSDQPVAVLLCTDLMFGVQLQSMARKAGYRSVAYRQGSAMPQAAVLVVDLGAHADWASAIREARAKSIEIVAFGPHVDSESRRKAKELGAARVLANSNLDRDLPGILVGLRDRLGSVSSEQKHVQDEYPTGHAKL